MISEHRRVGARVRDLLAVADVQGSLLQLSVTRPQSKTSFSLGEPERHQLSHLL